MPEAPRLGVLLIWEFLHWYASPGPLLLTGEVVAERIVYLWRVKGGEKADLLLLCGRKYKASSSVVRILLQMP